MYDVLMGDIMTNFEIIKTFENIQADCIVGENARICATNTTYSYGRVVYPVAGINGGKVYRVDLEYAVKNMDKNSRVAVMASWSDTAGKYVRRYLKKTAPGNMSLKIQLPDDLSSLQIEMYMWSCGGGEAVFEKPQFTCIGEYKSRNVTLATAWFDPRHQRKCEDNMEDILRIIDNAGRAETRPDVLVFSENIYARKRGKSLQESALTWDSQPMKTLCAKAKEYNMYLVLGLFINQNGVFKNCAVIFGRDGSIAGVCEKTHLPLEEVEMGIAPGNEFKVFDLDFGRVGILICWDHFFSEPARILQKMGAEVLLIPTIGITKYQVRARAADTGVYTLVSGQSDPDMNIIINPEGDIAAKVDDPELGFAAYTVDLNKTEYTHWMSVGDADGQAGELYMAERRPELYGDLV